MAVAEFHLGSNNALGKGMAFTAIVPDEGSGPFPVLYLLGGLSDDHSNWHRMTGIQRYVDGVPLIVVMPNGERGFYTDNPSRPNANYETYITENIVGFVDNTFHTIPTAKGRATAGLSMGGYGGLKFPLKYPNLFSAGASLSGSLAFAHTNFVRDERFELEFRPVVGKNPAGGENDLFALASKIPKAKRPPLFITCGTEDFLIDHNRSFNSHLKSMKYAHVYEEHPGGHTWSYWNRHILGVLDFLKEPLNLGDINFFERL